MNKNQIRGSQCRTSELVFTKSLSIKGTGCKSGGRALKAGELTLGGLSSVLAARLRMERSILTGREESAEGIVVPTGMKA
jgi:hypothetical protein